jgi:hypothetical protein
MSTIHTYTPVWLKKYFDTEEVEYAREPVITRECTARGRINNMCCLTQPFRTFEEAQKYLLEHLCYSRVFQLKDEHVDCYEVWEFAVLTDKGIIGFMSGDVDEFATTHKTTPLWVRVRNKEILKDMQMRSRK